MESSAHPFFMPSNALVTGVAFLATTIVLRVIWNLRLSPLARQRIPGPWYAAISDIWYGWHGVTCDRTPALAQLFEQYGPVVRIGANRVAFNDVPTIHRIYRDFAFNKGAFFKYVTFGGKDNTVATTDPTLHGRFRRWHAPGFRGDRLRKTAIELEEQMEDLVERVRSDAADGAAVNILRILKVHTLDMLGIALFDTKFLQLRNREEQPIVQYNLHYLVDVALRTSLSAGLYRVAQLIPVKALRDVFAADTNICNFCSKLYDAAPDEPTDSDAMNLMAAGKHYRDPTTGEAESKEQVVAEMAAFLLGGTDGSSVVLTYLLYELARQPKIYNHARAEMETMNDVYNIDALRALPYLNAFLKDCLRVRNPLGVFIERIIPADKSAALSGYHIPGGTVVGGSAWSTGRIQSLFPDPERIDPERWVTMTSSSDGAGTWRERDDIPTADMNAAWWSFGLGVRACVGRPLAEVEILQTLAAVISNFRLRLHESTTEESMGPQDLTVIGPRARKCLLYFDHHPINA
ncbi:cytochrome P450 [Auriculariales sp. MPI-PUGE-AT-0066]|nr:cytochrome P450 [Auriculariales sp. MPI-PUGE-AT-0066]